MDLVPKSVLRTLDSIDSSLNEFEAAFSAMSKDESIESNSTQRANRDLAVALAITGLLVLNKRAKGEDPEEALVQFEKCKKAVEKVSKGGDDSKATEKTDKSTANKRVSGAMASSSSASSSNTGKVPSKKKRI